MNVLFLSLGEFDDLTLGSVHLDLVRKFSQNHNVYLVCKTEKRNGIENKAYKAEGINVLKIKTGNIKNVGLIEKGISTIKVEKQFIKGIKQFYSNIKFDLVIYSTPPVTFAKVVSFVKKRDGAKSYLLLKDIFPQNAVDIDMLSKKGIKGIIYKYFRTKEKNLYGVSDYIGCMSKANLQYVLNHNPELNSEIVEVCPNCINPRITTITANEAILIRQKYGIPTDKKVFIYGGNLGKPQGVSFLIECLRGVKENKDAFFLVIGSGTEYSKLDDFIKNERPQNVKLMKSLPREEYDCLVAACDVGLVFLDYRFTIPNFPSRILSYMQAMLPVLCVTDLNTDIGKTVEEGKFGWWCYSNDKEAFRRLIIKICSMDFEFMKVNSRQFLEMNYDVSNAYEIIIKHF